MRLKGSLYRVVQHARKGVAVQRQWVATSITVEGERCIVRSIDGQEEQGDAVVVAVPLSVLQRKDLVFTPRLPRDVRDGISSMTFDSAVKVMVKLSRRIWPESLHGCICMYTLFPEIWFDNDPSTASYYAIAFATGEYATQIANMETEMVCMELVDQLSRMFSAPHGEARASYCGGVLVDWGEVPYIWGGYSSPARGEHRNARESLTKPVHGRIFFAGEHTDPHQVMTVHAAMETGARAAQGILSMRGPEARL